jgi:hypothetical protein
MWWVISGEGPSAVLRAALRLPHTQIPVGARPGCLISISSADARFFGLPMASEARGLRYFDIGAEVGELIIQRSSGGANRRENTCSAKGSSARLIRNASRKLKPKCPTVAGIPSHALISCRLIKSKRNHRTDSHDQSSGSRIVDLTCRDRVC